MKQYSNNILIASDAAQFGQCLITVINRS